MDKTVPDAVLAVDSPQSDVGGLGGLFVSIGFWVCLLFAAAAYAVATLSTGYVEHQRLVARFAAGAAGVRRLADQVEDYERYCRRLAESESARALNAATARSMRVDDALQFHLAEPDPSSPGVASADSVPPIVLMISRSTDLRRATLLAASVLVVLAFSTLVESREEHRNSSGQRTTRSLGSRLRQWGTRYQFATPADPSRGANRPAPPGRHEAAV